MVKEKKRCKKCNKKIGGFFDFAEDQKMEGYCIHCSSKIKREEVEKEAIKQKKRYASLPLNERIIEDQIRELEGMGGAVLTLVILGVIGLFAFLLPGIIFFIIAAVVSSSRKSKAASLRAQLQGLRQKK